MANESIQVAVLLHFGAIAIASTVTYLGLEKYHEDRSSVSSYVRRVAKETFGAEFGIVAENLLARYWDSPATAIFLYSHGIKDAPIPSFWAALFHNSARLACFIFYLKRIDAAIAFVLFVTSATLYVALATSAMFDLGFAESRTALFIQFFVYLASTMFAIGSVLVVSALREKFQPAIDRLIVEIQSLADDANLRENQAWVGKTEMPLSWIRDFRVFF